MSTLITDWREAVVSYLKTTFPDATVVSGQRAGVNRRDEDLICVWWPGWPELQRDVALATPKLIIRYFPSLSKQIPTDAPPDPTPLEKAAEDVMVAFKTKRLVGAFVANLGCRITNAVPNYDPAQWHVEFTVLALTLNLAGSAA